MVTYKITLVSVIMGVNRTIECADKQTINDAAVDVACPLSDCTLETQVEESFR
jgi:hypothetical protein